jgi:hypothetical protein
MIQDTAEKLLTDVLGRYGAAVCDTPQMLETLLRKHGRVCPREIEVLSTALKCGVVSQLRSDNGVTPASLARLLVLDTHVPPGQAEWVVTAWSNAIAKAPARTTTQSPADTARRPAGSIARSAVFLSLAVATGVIAYLAFAP